jgi:hypothetical protein
MRRRSASTRVSVERRGRAPHCRRRLGPCDGLCVRRPRARGTVHERVNGRENERQAFAASHRADTSRALDCERPISDRRPTEDEARTAADLAAEAEMPGTQTMTTVPMVLTIVHLCTMKTLSTINIIRAARIAPPVDAR